MKKILCTLLVAGCAMNLYSWQKESTTIIPDYATFLRRNKADEKGVKSVDITAMHKRFLTLGMVKPTVQGTIGFTVPKNTELAPCQIVNLFRNTLDEDHTRISTALLPFLIKKTIDEMKQEGCRQITASTQDNLWKSQLEKAGFTKDGNSSTLRYNVK